MVTIKRTSGSLWGRVQYFTYPPTHEVAVALLFGFAAKRWTWEIDVSMASPDEHLMWGRADMHVRIFAALIHKRPIRFRGKRWTFTEEEFPPYFDPEKLKKVMVELCGSDASDAGIGIYVLIDDLKGDLVLGIRRPKELI